MKLKIKHFIILISLLSVLIDGNTQVPEVYNNIFMDEDGSLYLDRGGRKIKGVDYPGGYTLNDMIGSPEGTETGIKFNFNDENFNGVLYYGLIHYSDSKHPTPVYFRTFTDIVNGQAEINLIPQMTGKYDMTGWQESGIGTLGYRVVNYYGELIYDGRITFTGTGPFEIGNTIIEGPFISLLSHENVTLWFRTSKIIQATIVINDQEIKDEKAVTFHQIEISGLTPDTEYAYTILYGGEDQTYSFRTAPVPGSRTPFTFSYTSDSRTGQGGGERSFYGVNYYIMRKILALSSQYQARFMQFTGDLINGYLTDKEKMDLQYSNWKRSIEAFAHYFPVYPTMGNHEALSHAFYDTLSHAVIEVDRFPFETESAEAVFGEHFVLPENGPESEDGAWYDPDPQKIDFPSYKENVFYYTYDNIGMVVLNSNYWYASKLAAYPHTSGNLHGYLMDKQLEWLGEVLDMFEKDENIDHVFVTQHTPAFPNGGHVNDDMWYNGRNDFRAFVSGKPVNKGIIERRDEYLDLLMNRSSKVIALLTGDEHNYNRMKITDTLELYPDMYFLKKINISRPLYQINNGAAGAPYYAQEKTPWSEAVKSFTTQTAVVFVHVHGKKVWMEVINPDTLEKIDETVLRE